MICYSTGKVGVCVPRKDHHLGHAQYLLLWVGLTKKTFVTPRLTRNDEGFVMWQGRLDSNQRMAGSKPAALPLGDAPVEFYILTMSIISVQISFVVLGATSRCLPLVLQSLVVTLKSG